MSAAGIVERAAASVPLTVMRRVIRRRPLGVMYHVVSDEHLPHISHVLQYKPTAAFERDLQFLQERCGLVDYQAAVELTAPAGSNGSGAPAANPVVLTFDDGYAECSSVVRPILLRRGIPCTFFVIADAVDNRCLVYPNKISLCIGAIASAPPDDIDDLLRELSRRACRELSSIESAGRWLRSLQIFDVPLIDDLAPLLGLDWDRFLAEQQPFMTRAEIRALADEGFTIGAHSCRHPYLKNLGDLDAVEEEIVASCRAVMDMTGQPSVPFAFPFSGDGLDRRFLADLRRRHDYIGLMFDTRELRRDEPFVVNRVPGDGGLTSWAGKELSDTFAGSYRRFAAQQVLAQASALRRRLPVGS
jgi:peptidoglycan/xylan/chitin deacetylase (PgdA/CDA1 family)